MKAKYVVITRPRGRGSDLKSKLESSDIKVIEQPCLEIKILTLDKSTLQKIYNNNFDILIFVSVNAVDGFFSNIDLNKLNITRNTKVIAIGKKTAEQLYKYGIKNVIYPDSQNIQTSEHLIEIDCLKNIKLKKVLLARGDVSRKYLANYLLKNKAELHELIVYESKQPCNLSHDLIKIIERLLQKKVNSENIIITITSSSILENLVKCIPEQYLSFLRQINLLVVSERIATLANEHQFKNITISNTMNDDNIKSIIDNM